jgi:hypothetical protein
LFLIVGLFQAVVVSDADIGVGSLAASVLGRFHCVAFFFEISGLKMFRGAAVGAVLFPQSSRWALQMPKSPTVTGTIFPMKGRCAF